MFGIEVNKFLKANKELQTFFETLIKEKLTERPHLDLESGETYYDFYRRHEALLEGFDDIINEHDWYELIQPSYSMPFFGEDDEIPRYYIDTEYAPGNILSVAIKAGFEKLVVFLLTEDVDPNKPNEELVIEEIDDFSYPGAVGSYENTIIHSYPLHEAVAVKRNDIVKLLLDYDADRTVINDNGETPLHQAAKMGNLELVKLLLEYKTEKLAIEPYILQATNGRDSGKTALHFAAEALASDVIKYLRQRSQNKLDDLKNTQGMSALDNVRYIQTKFKNLHSKEDKKKAEATIEALIIVDKDLDNAIRNLFSAIEKGDLAFLKKLISEKPQLIESRNSYTNTPLYEAIYSEKFAIVDYLIEKSADINARCFEGKTSLHIAAKKRQTQITAELLAKGANINAKDDYEAIPLQNAVGSKGDNIEIIKLLLQQGAPIRQKIFSSNYITDVLGQNYIHAAACVNNYKDIEFLISETKEVGLLEQVDGYGRRPIHYAAEKGRVETLNLLLELGAKIEATDQYGRAPIHYAAEKNQGKILAILLSKGNKNQIALKDYYERTPLHMAASSGAADAVDYLLANGAELTALDNKGRTPLHLAARDGQLDMLRYMLKQGIDILKKDKKGDTPLAVAHRHHRNYKNNLGKYDENKYHAACELLREAENKQLNKHEMESVSYRKNASASRWKPQDQRNASFRPKNSGMFNEKSNEQMENNWRRKNK